MFHDSGKLYQQPFLLRFAPGVSRGVLGLPLDDDPVMQSIYQPQARLCVEIVRARVVLT